MSKKVLLGLLALVLIAGGVFWYIHSHAPLAGHKLQAAVHADGQQVALAIRMYAVKHGGNLPPASSAVDELLPYVANHKEIFVSPNDGKAMLQMSASGNINSMPETTVVGILDTGGGCKVELHADGTATDMK